MATPLSEQTRASASDFGARLCAKHQPQQRDRSEQRANLFTAETPYGFRFCRGFGTFSHELGNRRGIPGNLCRELGSFRPVLGNSCRKLGNSCRVLGTPAANLGTLPANLGASAALLQPFPRF